MSGKTFRIYKFRSMYTDSEARGRAIWAKKEDTRITWIGRFMRATHIDETPQVFNILRGDMSLIGPRPERAEFVASLERSYRMGPSEIPLWQHRGRCFDQTTI